MKFELKEIQLKKFILKKVIFIRIEILEDLLTYLNKIYNTN